MSNREKRFIFHTAIPQKIPPEYRGGTYAHVLGIESETGSVFQPRVREGEAQLLTFKLPAFIGEGVKDYFEEYYIKRQSAYRNCHIAVAAILRTGDVSWVDALEGAIETVKHGRVINPVALKIGQRAVFGGFYENEPMAFHSVVGIAKGIGVQTDNENGPLSIVSHAHNLNRYRVQERLSDLQAYV